jgi:hypothetical protein
MIKFILDCSDFSSSFKVSFYALDENIDSKDTNAINKAEFVFSVTFPEDKITDLFSRIFDKIILEQGNSFVILKLEEGSLFSFELINVFSEKYENGYFMYSKNTGRAIFVG